VPLYWYLTCADPWKFDLGGGILIEIFDSIYGVSQYVNIQCQNLNWISAQATGVVHLASNFMKHLDMLIKHDLHRKRNIFRTFAPSTTSAKMAQKKK
jgi:hypothetical protein